MALSRLLIVNADDFGLTPSTSAAIVEAHRHGIVTATSALVVAPGFERSAHLLAEHPGLGAGLHLALVGADPPLLGAREVPTLVDGSGRLAASWRSFLWRALRGRIDPADVRRELDAQLEAFASATGRRPDHLDSHQHLHLLPSVAAVLVEAAEERGVPAIRVPEGAGAHWPAMAALTSRLRRTVAAAGLHAPERWFGFAERGRADAAGLRRMLRRAASSGAASVELGLHVGPADDPDRRAADHGYRWGDELEAVTEPGLRQRVEQMGFRLGVHEELA